MHDHRQVELNRQIELGAKDGQLLRKVLVTKKIKTKFTDGHHPIIGAGSIPQYCLRIFSPVLRIKRMDTHRVPHLRKPIRKSANRRNLRRLNTSM